MEEKQQKKSGRGGSRPGAGRKGHGGVKYYGFRATQQVHDILEAVGGSKTDFINQCIIKAVQHP